MNIGALAGLAGVPRGEQIGADARASNALKALQIKAAQRQMEDADQQRKAQEFAFGILSGGDVGQLGQPMPQLPQAPGPQSPMPGQASVPMIHPGMADPSMPMPSPAAPPPVAGAAPSPTPTPGGGAPPMQAPPGAMPGGQAGAMPGGMGQYDIRTLAQRIKQENPGADPRVLFKTLVEADKLLNPQAKMELQMLIGQMKADAVVAKMEANFALQDEKLRSQEERAKAYRDLQRELNDARINAKDEATRLQIQAMQDRVTMQLNAMDERQRRAEEGKDRRAAEKKTELKPPPVGAVKDMNEHASVIRVIDTALDQIEANPKSGGMIKGAVNSLPGGDILLNAVDPKGVEARAGVADVGSMQLRLRSGQAVTLGEWSRTKPFIPQIGDSDKVKVQKLERIRNIVRNELEDYVGNYNEDAGFQVSPTVRSALGDRAPKAPAGAKGAPAKGAATPQESVTATNPQTGEKIQWDGSQWVPVSP